MSALLEDQANAVEHLSELSAAALKRRRSPILVAASCTSPSVRILLCKKQACVVLTWGKGREERRVDDDGMCRGTAAAGRWFLRV